MLSYIYNFHCIIECHPTCLECLDGTKAGCTKCTGNLFLYESECLNICPNGTFPLLNYCINCEPPCLTCTSEIECKSCIDNSFLLTGNSVCLARNQCPIGTYADDNLRLCANCHISCATCIGSSSTECISCKTILGYAEKLSSGPGECQKVICTQGQYLNISVKNAICLPCNPECITCSSESPTYCTTCKKEYLAFPAVNGSVYCKTCNELLGLKKSQSYGVCEGILRPYQILY